MTLSRVLVGLACAAVACLAVPEPRVLQLQNMAAPWFWVPVPEDSRIMLTEFAWSSCGPSSDLLDLQKLAVAPDPIVVPGNLIVNASATLAEAVSSPAKAVVKLYKKAVVWVELPCISNVGSCTYDDACALLSKIPAGSCPLPTCQCPFAAGPYLVNQTVALPAPSNVPSWLADGDFKAQVTLTNSDGKEVACLVVQVALKFNKQPVGTGAISKRFKFTHAVSHADATQTIESCDPSDFEYQVCNLTSTQPNKGCSQGQFCKQLVCPFPGQCWLPNNCTCNPSTRNLNCTTDPTHSTECNARNCGLCETAPHRRFSPATHKAFSFRGSRAVPVTLHYENSVWNWDAPHDERSQTLLEKSEPMDEANLV